MTAIIIFAIFVENYNKYLIIIIWYKKLIKKFDYVYQYGDNLFKPVNESNLYSVTSIDDQSYVRANLTFLQQELLQFNIFNYE